MDAHEMARRAFEDRGFLADAFGSMSSREFNRISRAHEGQEGSACDVVAECLMPYVRMSALSVTEDELVSELKSRYDSLGMFGRLLFGLRAARSLSAAGHGKR